MKIQFFSRFLWPTIGGVEKHAFEVARELVRRGHKVTVVCENHGQLPEKENIDDIEVFRINVPQNERLKKFTIWKWMFKNRNLLEKADIVHCHDVFYWYLPFRFLYPPKPVFTTFHGYEMKFPPKKKAIIIRKLSEKLSFGNICVGDYIKKWYGTNPYFVTYGGVNLPKTPLENVNSKTITFIGRLEEDLGLRTYLRAIDILKKKSPGLKIEFLGDGKLRNLAEKYGKVNGFCPNIASYIQKSRFIFASSYLSMLEALINKRLVFSVYENPLKEDYLKLSPFRNFIIIENNPINLAMKIEEMLKNPQREKQLIEKGYIWAKNQTWSKVTDLYLKLWKIK